MPPGKNEEEIESLPDWDVAQCLYADGLYLGLGDRGSGKTSWIEFILQQDPKINESILIGMCGSEKVMQHWRKVLPRLQVVDPSVSYLQTVMKKQNKHIARYNKLGLPLPYRLHVDLILDDVALYAEIVNDPIFKQLAAQSRQLGMRVFVLCQYFLQAPKATRGAFDAIFCVGAFDDETVKILHKKYGMFVNTIRLFTAYLRTYTKDNGLFVIDKKNQECAKMMIDITFSEDLVDLRFQNKMSLETLAEMLDISVSLLQLWENKEELRKSKKTLRPKPEQVEQINKIFDSNIGYPFPRFPLGSPAQHAVSKEFYEKLEFERAKEADRDAMTEDQQQEVGLTYEDNKGVIVFRKRDDVIEDEDVTVEYDYDENNYPESVDNFEESHEELA